MRKRKYELHIFLNQEEWKQLELLRTKTGLSSSSVIRRLIQGTPIQERPNMDYRELRRAIDRIGNNYNQIAYKANRTDSVSNADWKESRRLLEEVKAEIERWKKIWL